MKTPNVIKLTQLKPTKISNWWGSVTDDWDPQSNT